MTRFKQMLTMMLALALVFSLSIPAFAAEVRNDEFSIANALTTEETLGAESTEESSTIQPRGVLSGYGNGTTGQSGDYWPSDGEFYFDVTGSWSPFAGCTIKTEGFIENDCVLVYVYNEDGDVIVEKELIGSSAEIKNIPIFNVSPGRYRVYFLVRSSIPGTVHVWIY